MSSDEEKQKVRLRAKGRCEYCLAPEDVAGYTFHIEHIKPRKEGGRDQLSNYALACGLCNLRKGASLWRRIRQPAGRRGFLIPDVISGEDISGS
jgi:5-methylcytosine-specific restriction endonuclease McrA